jgi:hypothetical protein
MGPLQPDCFGQAWGHPIRPLRVELTEGKAQAAVAADRQQRACPGPVVDHLTAAGLEPLSNLIGAEGAPDHLDPEL